MAQLRELPQEERESLANSVIEEELASGSVPPLTQAQRRKLIVATAIPMVGFGFMDNAVMIVCGEFIEVNIGAVFCISTLTAAAFGNLISDLVGLGTGGIIEEGASKLGFAAPPLTTAQLASSSAVYLRHGSNACGLALGCVIGMFPLLFHNQEDMRLKTIFTRYDKDGSGSLSWDEIWQAFNDAKMYPSENDMRHLFDKYDLDKDGQIEFEEFKVMAEDLEDRLKQDSNFDARSLMASTAHYLEIDD